jgi:hypothetical protein
MTICQQQERVLKRRGEKRKKKSIGFLGDKKGGRNIILDLKNGNDNLKEKT